MDTKKYITQSFNANKEELKKINQTVHRVSDNFKELNVFKG